jgi:hypothetical protein
MGWFVPFSSYKARLFLARRLAGIPGYQYEIDVSKEYFQRQIFTKDELKQLRERFQNTPGFEYRKNFVFNKNLVLLDIKRIDEFKSDYIVHDDLDCNSNLYGTYKSEMNENESMDTDVEYLVNLLGLKHPSELLITEINNDNIKPYMNDAKFKLLSNRDQFLIKMCIHHVNMISNRLSKPFYEAGLDVLLNVMKRYEMH